MITYIAKFIICSGLLLAVYQVILSNERLYRFNRFYLLFSLIFSLTVPFIAINAPKLNLPYFNTEIKQPATQPTKVVQETATVDMNAEQLISTFAKPVVMAEAQQPVTPVLTSKPVAPPVVQTPWYTYLPQVLFAIYSLVAVVLLFRFAKNSRHITYLVGKNTVLNYQGTKLVLIDDDVTPHSFLKYVFINKDAYENGEVEPEIFCHEQAHIKQLHSLDVIFIELLQIVCWFNPFIIFYRRAIQLNHEFLADEQVIKNYDNTSAYQYLLLAKVSQAGSLNLTSQFNYLAIKKRLIMMTKRTSATVATYKKLAVLPFLAVAIFLFCQKSTAEIVKAVKPIGESNADTSKTITEEYNDILARQKRANPKGKVWYVFSVSDTKRLEAIFRRMTKEEQARQWFKFAKKQYKFPSPIIQPTENEMTKWQDNTKYEIWINDKKIKNDEINKLDASKFTFGRVKTLPSKNGSSGQQIYLETRAYYAKHAKALLADTGWVVVANKQIPDEKTIAYAKYGNRQATNTGDKTLEEAEALKRISQWPIPAAGRIKHSIDDATPSVEVQYKYILKLRDIQVLANEGKGKLSDLSTIDTTVLHSLFSQMSKRQQDRQYVRFEKAIKPMPKNNVTQAQLQLWQDAKTYGVWIDEKRINNATLANYQPADFGHMFISKLTPIAVKGDGFKYQVDLMTKTYYADYYKKTMADQGDKILRIRVMGTQMSITQDKTYQPKNTVSANKQANVAVKPEFDNEEPKFVLPSPKSASAAKTDAPQNVLDEYAGILQRNKLPYKEGEIISIAPEFSVADKARLIKLYGQMSDAQQKEQYIRFMYPYPPGGVMHVTIKSLPMMMKNDPDRQFWIDGKKVDLNKLEKMPQNLDLYTLALMLKNYDKNNSYFTTNKKGLDYKVENWVKNHLTGFYIPGNNSYNN